MHKIHAFKTAISAIDGLPFQVQRIQDVEKIKGIGAGMKRRIEEALLEEEKQGIIPSTNGDVEDKKELLHAVQLFQTISGIGPMKAKKLAENGFRSLEDIMADKATFDKLSRSVQTSMKCGSRTLARIQREDITRLASLMSKVLKEFEVEVTGSYRRGAESSSDVDVLIFHPSYQVIPPQGQRPTKKAQQKVARDESPLLSLVIPQLTKAGILEEPLTSGPTKWQGLARLDPRVDRLCRIDLNLMPTLSRGAALLGYTGDAEFNRYLRAKAAKAGLRLNDFGLWKRPAGWEPSTALESKEDDQSWELVQTSTEQDVFEALDEGWIDPEKRNFGNLQRRKRKGSEHQ